MWSIVRSSKKAVWRTVISILIVVMLTAVDDGRQGTSGSACAQKPTTKSEEEEPAPPFAIVSVAGIDRVLEDVDYMFAAAGRPEFSDYVASLLGKVRDFQGMNRQKPFGVMVYLDPAIGLTPLPVGYVPVDNMDELMTTVSTGPVTMRKIDVRGDRYEIVGRRQTLQVRVQDGYAFIASDADLLDRDFGDPAARANPLAARYDIAVSVNLKSLPLVLRRVFAATLRASAEAELQQRDNESDARYRLRKATGEGWLERLDQTIQEGEALTIGANISSQNKTAALEAHLEVAPDGEFAEYLMDVAGQRSHFESLLEDQVPFTFSTSWSLDKSGKTTFSELVNLIEGQLSSGLLGKEPGADNPVSRLADIFRKTANAGHFDFLVQMRGDPDKAFVLIGALKVADEAKTSETIADVLSLVKKQPDVAELQLNAVTYHDIILHRIRGTRVRERDKRLYGTTPSLYVGGSENALWFVVGGPSAVTAFKEAVDRVKGRVRTTRTSGESVPFRLMVNMSPWVAMGQSKGPFAEIARNAFQPDNDGLRMEFRPTENGAKLRIEFEEGFIRLLGLAIANRLDQRLRL